MNKQNFMSELSRLLNLNRVADVEEILAEYDEHFERKLADGYTEDEIAAKLGSPKALASQFASEKTVLDSRVKRALLGVGMALPDICMASVFIVMFAWVLVLAASALAFAISGVCLLAGPILPETLFTMPYIPYFGGVLLSLGLAALGVLSGIGAVYSFAFTKRACGAYISWHKNIFDGRKHPPVALHPIISVPMARKLRNVGLVSLAVFGVGFIVGYIFLAVNAGSVEFWHVWRWFV